MNTNKSTSTISPIKEEQPTNITQRVATAGVGKMIHSLKTSRLVIATIATLTLFLPAASPVYAGGLRNCVDVVSPAVGDVGCYEAVWVNGVQQRMTFSNQQFTGATPNAQVGNFYVLAPQTATAQGALPFAHDHVVADAPSHNHGTYHVHLRGFFVLCSAQGIASGGCVPTMTSIQGLGTVPFATTVNGQLLTAVEPIESAANAGLVTLFDTGAVIIGTINPNK